MKTLKLDLQKAYDLVPGEKSGDFKSYVLKKLSSESNCFAREPRGYFPADAEYYRRLRDRGKTDEEIYETLAPERSSINFHDLLTFLSSFTDKTYMFDFLREYVDAVAFEIALLEKSLKK